MIHRLRISNVFSLLARIFPFLSGSVQYRMNLLHSATCSLFINSGTSGFSQFSISRAIFARNSSEVFLRFFSPTWGRGGFGGVGVVSEIFSEISVSSVSEIFSEFLREKFCSLSNIYSSEYILLLILVILSLTFSSIVG
nr:MAG TPA: hypothetical protein [Caudoviricetes sp.]